MLEVASNTAELQLPACPDSQWPQAGGHCSELQPGLVGTIMNRHVIHIKRITLYSSHNQSCPRKLIKSRICCVKTPNQQERREMRGPAAPESTVDVYAASDGTGVHGN